MTPCSLIPRSAMPKPMMSRLHAGFSMVELMVAIAVSLALMVGLVTLLVDINRSNSEMAKTNGQIESGRFTMQLLQSDLVQAGFWGSYLPQFEDLTLDTAPDDVPAAVPDPCQDFATWSADDKKNLIGISVQTFDEVPSSCTMLTHKQPDTDILVVRHAEACLPGTGNCEAQLPGRVYFQSSLCETEIDADLRYVLDTDNFTLKNRGCTGTPPAATVGTTADLRRFISNIYYVRSYASAIGDGIPTLVRSQFDVDAAGTVKHQEPVALIEGIERFRVELGIDDVSDSGIDIIDDLDPANRYDATIVWADTANMTSPTNRGDGAPDGAFIRCTSAAPCTAAQLTHVVAARLHVLARNREATRGHQDTKTYALGSTTAGPFNDDVKRHVFSTTVRLSNISGRRETP